MSRSTDAMSSVCPRQPVSPSSCPPPSNRCTVETPVAHLAPTSVQLWPGSLHGRRQLWLRPLAAGRLGELVPLSSRLAPCPGQGGPSPAGSRGRLPGQLGLATVPVTHCSLKDTPKLNGFNDSHLLGSRLSYLGKVLGEDSSLSHVASARESILGAGGPSAKIWLPGWCWPLRGAQEGCELGLLSMWDSPCGLGFLSMVAGLQACVIRG